MQLVCIDPARVAEFWPRVVELMRAACEKTSMLDLGELQRQVLAGEALLWLAWDGAIKAAAVSQLTLANERKFCTIVACGSPSRHDMPAWLPLLTQIDAYAKHNGCVAMRVIGRTGWQRVLKGYAVSGYILERTL